MFFGVLNETVFNVSTPAIAREYGLNPSGVSWVMTTFIVRLPPLALRLSA